MKSYILSSILLLLLLLSCKEDKTEDSPAADVAPVPNRTQVVVDTPSVQSMKEEITMNAVTAYTHRENIRATTTGYIQQSQVILGNRIKAGQEVFTIKTKEAEALGENILSDPDINITGIVAIHSKNAGIISQVFFQDGDYVIEGDVLAELTKPNSLAIKLYVPYEYNHLVGLKKGVSISLPDGEILKGTVRQLLPTEDVVSQTTPYLVSIKPFRFLPENLNVTVTLTTKTSNQAMVIPSGAMQSNEEQTQFWVMKIVHDTLAVKTLVEPGMRTNSFIEIKNAPITTSDKIVVQGAYGLPDTAAVSLVDQL